MQDPLNTNIQNQNMENKLLESVREAKNEDKREKLKYNYGIMGDLGSSGSRVYVYRWITNKQTDQKCSIGGNGEFTKFSLIPGWEETIGEFERNEQKPGISFYAKPPFAVSGGLEKILNFAMNLIPSEKRSQTPIYFFATAGLRVLAEEQGERIYDDDDSDEDYMLEEDDDEFGVGNVSQLLLAIKQYVSQNFPFIIRQNHVKILAGKEEAMYLWISLQHMLRSGGNLLAKEMTIPLNPGPLENGIFNFGAIDCGGASAQLVYQPSNFFEGNIRLKSGVFSDQLTEISLFAQSYLGYGMYESRGNFETFIGKKQLSGFVLDLPKKQGLPTLTNPCFLFNNTQHISIEKTKFQVDGTGNFDQCWSELLNIFKFSHCNENAVIEDGGDNQHHNNLIINDQQEIFESEKCNLEGVELPKHKSDVRFIAIDNAYRAAKFFDKLGFNTIHELENSVRSYCAMEWNSAITKYTPLVTEFRLKRYCYEGVYLVMLLRLGFKFPNNYPIVGFSDYIQGIHLNWGMGAFAYQLHQSCLLGDL